MKKQLLALFTLGSALFGNEPTLLEMQKENEANLTKELAIAHLPIVPITPEPIKNYYKDLQSSMEANLSAKSTLFNAIEIAIDNSYILKSALEKTYQATHSLSEAQSALHPSATTSFEDGYSRQYFVGSPIDSFESRVLSLSLQYNIYDAGATYSRIDQSHSGINQAVYLYRQTLEKEILKTIEAYLGVVFNYMSIKSNRTNMAKLNEILEIVKIKRQNGAATIGDESSIAASVANAKASLVKIESKYSDSKSYYEYILGVTIDNFHPYEAEYNMLTATLEEVLENVSNHNIEILINQTKRNSKKSELKAHNAAFKPTLDFSLSVSKRNSNFGGNGIEDDTRAMLKLAYLLYDGGKRESKEARILSEIAQLNYLDEQNRKKLMWDVKKLHNSINTLDDTLTNTHEELSATYTMVKTYWETFKLSSQDLDILLQAQRQLNKTQLNILRYQQNRINDFFKLLAKEGKLISYFKLD
jgi:outer membrane protein, adhesin transport system